MNRGLDYGASATLGVATEALHLPKAKSKLAISMALQNVNALIGAFYGTFAIKVLSGACLLFTTVLSRRIWRHD